MSVYLYRQYSSSQLKNFVTTLVIAFDKWCPLVGIAAVVGVEIVTTAEKNLPLTGNAQNVFLGKSGNIVLEFSPDSFQSLSRGLLGVDFNSEMLSGEFGYVFEKIAGALEEILLPNVGGEENAIYAEFSDWKRVASGWVCVKLIGESWTGLIYVSPRVVDAALGTKKARPLREVEKLVPISDVLDDEVVSFRCIVGSTHLNIKVLSELQVGDVVRFDKAIVNPAVLVTAKGDIASGYLCSKDGQTSLCVKSAVK